MARIRSIKPEFWTDEALTECSLSARLLFIGTWNFADDQGNLDRSSKQIKARVFPLDTIDCEPLIQELIAQGLLTEYSVNSKIYLHIQGFTKHQIINRPSKPTCPAFDESLAIHSVLTEHSLSTHIGRDGKGKELKAPVEKLDGIPCETPNPKPLQTTDLFLKFWAAWPKSQRKVGKAPCAKRWKSRGLDSIADKIMLHVEAMKKTDPWRTGFEPAPETYINQSRWEDEVPGQSEKSADWKSNPTFAGIAVPT